MVSFENFMPFDLIVLAIKADWQYLTFKKIVTIMYYACGDYIVLHNVRI